MNYQIISSIVVYKTDSETLKRTIDCFLNTRLTVKLYIVDNSTADELRNFINNYKDIEYIFNNSNIGYGAGHNIAIKKSIDKSKYHLVLNPDIYFKEGTIDKIYTYMEENPDIGLLMPKILYPDNKIQYLCKLLPNPFILLIRRFVPIAFLKSKINWNYELRFTKYNCIMNVPFLSGCFMFLQTEALKSIGLFDEKYFMYLEDVDLCRRIASKYRTVFYPYADVFHEYERGSYKNLKLLLYFIQSIFHYYNKWGWFFDKEKKKINLTTLLSLKNSKS